MRRLDFVLGLSAMLAIGCGLFGGGNAPKDQSAAKGAHEGQAGDNGAQTADGKTADGTPAEPEAPKKMTQAELEQAMAPPDGVMDLRPLLGTDPDQLLPAIFKDVTKGMSPADLNKVFKGAGAHKVAFVNLTTAGGGNWYRVKGNQPHRELLDIKYDDDMLLVKIGYMVDPKKRSPALWSYLKKAAGLKWGKPDLGDLNDDSEFARWNPKGVKEITISGGGSDNLISFDVEL